MFYLRRHFRNIIFVQFVYTSLSLEYHTYSFGFCPFPILKKNQHELFDMLLFALLKQKKSFLQKGTNVQRKVTKTNVFKLFP